MNRVLHLIASLIVGTATVSHSATIESAAPGGAWDDTLTWVGNIIPRDSDDVILSGLVTITSPAVIQNLTVSTTATLQNGGGIDSVTLSVLGNILNNGTIRNNPASNKLRINIYGDIANNGTWVPAKTFFASRRVQRISQSAGTQFAGSFRKTDADGTTDTFALVAASDIVVNGSEFSGFGIKDNQSFWGVLDMAGFSLTLKGATVLSKVMLEHVGTLLGRDSSALSSCVIIGAVTLAGEVTLIDGNVTFNGDVTVADTLQNGGTFGWLTPKFMAKLTNNGTIRNNPKGNNLWVDLYGDVMNNGTWIPAKTFFASKRVQTVSQAVGAEFTGALFKTDGSGYADTFPTIAGSDLVVNATSFDGNGYRDDKYFRGIIDMGGHMLTLKGGTSLVNMQVRNAAALVGRDSSTVSGSAFDGAVSLGGCITLSDGNVTFGGDVTVADTLQNGGSLETLTPVFKAKLTNNGTIRSNPRGNELRLELFGDAVNNGAWQPATTFFASGRPQSIGQSPGTVFGGRLLKTDAAGRADTFPLVAASDIAVNGPEFNLMGFRGNYFWGILDMAGHHLTLRGSTILTSGNIRHVDTLSGFDAAAVRSLTIDDSVRLADTVTVSDGSVTINGHCTVNGVLQNGGTLGWLTLAVNGGIVNNGTIRNNPTGNAIWLDIKGDIANGGTWTNAQNTLNDTADQTIFLVNDIAIAAPVIFDALWPEEPYQWTKNGDDWGAAAKTVYFDLLTVASAGVYQCKHGESTSRTITVKNGEGSGIAHRPSSTSVKEALRFGWGLLQNGRLTLRIAAPECRRYTLRLFDLGGRQQSIRKGDAARGISTIALERPAAGTYLACFESGALRETRRVLIVR